MIFGVIILSRYFQIQIFGVDDFQRKLSEKVEYKKSIKGERGRIFDRNGELLAGGMVPIAAQTCVALPLHQSYKISLCHLSEDGWAG